MTETGSEKVEGIVVVPEQTEQWLNQRQLEDYRSHRVQLIRWMLHLGKNPEKAEGYAFDTVRQRCYKIDRFYRWIWDQEDGYTLSISVEHADQYSKEFAYEETSQTHRAGVQKATKSTYPSPAQNCRRSVHDPYSTFPTTFDFDEVSFSPLCRSRTSYRVTPLAALKGTAPKPTAAY